MITSQLHSSIIYYSSTIEEDAMNACKRREEKRGREGSGCLDGGHNPVQGFAQSVSSIKGYYISYVYIS